MTIVTNYKMGLAESLLGKQFGFAVGHSKHSPDGLAYAIRYDPPVVAIATIHGRFQFVETVRLFLIKLHLVGQFSWLSAPVAAPDSQYVARWYLIW